MPREDYEERKAARIERLEERAAKARAASTAAYQQSNKMADAIPFGQPILVGHHSEKRDRNYRERMQNKMRQSCELSTKANRLAERAASAESNTAISADDPEAVAKLKEKLADEEAIHEANKAANRKLRKAKIPVAECSRERIEAAGVTDKRIVAELLSLVRIRCMYGQYVKLPSYEISNRNANMKRMRERIAELSQAPEETETIQCDGFEIVHNADENRVQLIFPGKPSEAIRSILKRNGFRWSRYNSAWQRQLNGNGKAAAHWVAEEIAKLEGGAA